MADNDPPVAAEDTTGLLNYHAFPAAAQAVVAIRPNGLPLNGRGSINSTN